MKQGFGLNYTVRAYMNIGLISRMAYISIDYSLRSISLRNLIIHNQVNYYYTNKLLKPPTFLKKDFDFKLIYIASSFIYAYTYILSRSIVYRILSWKHFDLINICLRISTWAFECTTLLVIGDCINCNAVDAARVMQFTTFTCARSAIIARSKLRSMRGHEQSHDAVERQCVINDPLVEEKMNMKAVNIRMNNRIFF